MEEESVSEEVSNKRGGKGKGLFSYSIIRESYAQFREATSFSLTRSVFNEFARRREAARQARDSLAKDAVFNYDEQIRKEGLTDKMIKKVYRSMRLSAFFIMFLIAYALMGLIEQLLEVGDLIAVVTYLAFLCIAGMLYIGFVFKMWRIRARRLDSMKGYLGDVKKNFFNLFPLGLSRF